MKKAGFDGGRGRHHRTVGGLGGPSPGAQRAPSRQPTRPGLADRHSSRFWTPKQPNRSRKATRSSRGKSARPGQLKACRAPRRSRTGPMSSAWCDSRVRNRFQIYKIFGSFQQTRPSYSGGTGYLHRALCVTRSESPHAMHGVRLVTTARSATSSIRRGRLTALPARQCVGLRRRGAGRARSARSSRGGARATYEPSPGCARSASSPASFHSASAPCPKVLPTSMCRAPRRATQQQRRVVLEDFPATRTHCTRHLRFLPVRKRKHRCRGARCCAAPATCERWIGASWAPPRIARRAGRCDRNESETGPKAPSAAAPPGDRRG